MEVFLQQRHPNSKFVGGAYVFPGGKLDAEDHHYSQYSLAKTLNTANNRHLLEVENAQAYFIAVIRECFEEAGILLAHENNSMLEFNSENKRNKYINYRQQLSKKSISFSQMCQQENLTLALDSLYSLSHWITPESLPMRYDTRFFVARMPDQQEGFHDGYEAIDSLWITPAAALEKKQKGEIELILPTLHTLMTLNQFPTLNAVIDSLSH